MPQFDRFLISPFNTGWQTDLRPWLIMDDAFAELRNAFVFRGRVRKRFGSTPMGQIGQLGSRLRLQVGTYGVPVSPVPGSVFEPGQMFSVGNDIFTVYQTGTPAAMLSTNPNATGTFNTTTGAFVINYTSGAPAGTTPIFFYPSQPVMGITQYLRGELNDQKSYAFDTQFAYLYNGAAWERSGTGVTPIWHGNNLDFFNICNWFGDNPSDPTMYVTNFNYTVPAPGVNDDPIWYTTDGINWVSMTGANGIYFAPDAGPQTGPFVQTCRLIVNFKGSLLLLNTIENDGSGVTAQYPSRARFSAIDVSPLAVNAWYEPNVDDGAGGLSSGASYIDAPTTEQIVSAQFIKDRLIVFFERSTWEIAWTGRELDPFVFQKINTELGSDAQNSSVPFDKEILTIGQTGIHACNGANTARIDQKIPDEIFDILDENLSVQRIAGVRDYFAECVYWAFPEVQETSSQFTYPNRVLVYNYRNNSWAVNDDCITAFGFWQQTPDLTWAGSAPITWQQATFPWNSGQNQVQARQIIAGDQQGFMFVVRTDITRNAPCMQITNIVVNPNYLTITSIDHTLRPGDFVYIESAQGSININQGIYEVLIFNYTLDTFSIEVPGYAGAYSGGGTITRVSNILIRSKQWNPYDKTGRNVSLARIEFAVQNTGTDISGNGVGQVTVESLSSSSFSGNFANTVNRPEAANTVTLETGPYPDYPLELTQSTLWHPVYYNTSGSSIQIEIYWSDEQIMVPVNAFSYFELQGIVLYTQATSNRLQ